jgi:transcriptional regulator with XRE-family HTH domain
VGSIGWRIKQLRKERGMTQAELAKKSGVSQPTISDYENGIAQQHRANVVLRIAAALEVTPEFLLTGTGDKSLNDMNPTLSELQDIYESLPKHLQAALIAAAQSLKNNQ